MDGVLCCGQHPQIPTVHNFAPSPKLQCTRAEGRAKCDKAANKRQRGCPIWSVLVGFQAVWRKPTIASGEDFVEDVAASGSCDRMMHRSDVPNEITHRD